MAISVPVDQEIRLDRFLKWAGISSTGGQSKLFIQSGMVSVNGVVETRRGRLLHESDLVKVENEGEYIVYLKNK